MSLGGTHMRRRRARPSEAPWRGAAGDGRGDRTRGTCRQRYGMGIGTLVPPTLAFRVSDVARQTCITSVLHACTRLHPDAVRSTWLSLMSLTLSGEWWRGVCVCASIAGFAQFCYHRRKGRKVTG